MIDKKLHGKYLPCISLPLKCSGDVAKLRLGFSGRCAALPSHDWVLAAVAHLLHGRGWAAYAAEQTFHWLVDSLALSGCGWAAAAAMCKRKDPVFRPGLSFIPVYTQQQLFLSRPHIPSKHFHAPQVLLLIF